MELSLYRKYRPQTFAEIAGQDHVSTTLQNAVRSGTVAHAYVFAGSRGTGKTSHGQDPGQGAQLHGARRRARGHRAHRHALRRVRQLPLDRRLDGTRRDRDGRRLQPRHGRHPRAAREGRIRPDAAARRSTSSTKRTCSRSEAFNALLKTLEEPPAHVVFILATTEVHKIPARSSRAASASTSAARCVHDTPWWWARSPPPSSMRSTGSPPCSRSRATPEGGFRDAIGTLEKLTTYFGEGAHHLARGARRARRHRHRAALRDRRRRDRARPTAALLFVQRLAEHGTSYPQFIHDLLRHLRQVFLVQYFSDVSRRSRHAGRALAEPRDRRAASRSPEPAGQPAPPAASCCA